MNAGFSGAEGGVDTGFRFSLAGVDRTVNAEWYLAGPTTSAERAMKKALKQGGANALNHYSTTAGAFLGWSYFPNIVDNGTSYLDGIVVDWESMPGTSTRYAGKYDLGKTGTHEAGHWVNLYHTFQGACNNWATTSTTRRRRASPRSGARRVRTPAPSRVSTRSTTTWTTRSTPVTTSSPPARPPACRTPGCTGAHRRRSSNGRTRTGWRKAGPFRFGARLAASRASSSGDRARASGARGRRFDSCLAHSQPPR